jgi:hypothetical protein
MVMCSVQIRTAGSDEEKEKWGCKESSGYGSQAEWQESSALYNVLGNTIVAMIRNFLLDQRTLVHLQFL